MKKETIIKMIQEEMTRVIEEYTPDGFSDLEGEEGTSWEPEEDFSTHHDAAEAIQLGVNAILEALYQFDPSQEALDKLESDLYAAMADVRRGSINDIVSGKARI
jgi:hypothetical protein